MEYREAMGIGYFAYCETCGRRVEPADLRRGLATRMNGRHFCRACLATAGITPGAPPSERKATVWLELDALNQAMAERETRKRPLAAVRR